MLVLSEVLGQTPPQLASWLPDGLGRPKDSFAS